jgi:spore coat protein JB
MHHHLLEELQQLDFQLLELALYLDNHPNDSHSISKLNQIAEKRAKVAAEYEEHVGPLMQFGLSYSRYPWSWSQSPWPWQV